MPANQLTLEMVREAVRTLRRQSTRTVFIVPRCVVGDADALVALDQFRHDGPLPFDDIIFPDGRREPFRLVD